MKARKRIVLHCGMGKTGTSATQAWLRHHQDDLRSREIYPTSLGGVEPKDDDFPELQVHGSIGKTNVGQLRRWTRASEENRLSDVILAALAKIPLDGTLIVSAESFYYSLSTKDVDFFSFDRLVEHADVEVVAYLRPQHEYIVSAWLQWGITQIGRSLTSFFKESVFHLLYADIVRFWQRFSAEGLSFWFLPYSSTTDTARDFARRVLGWRDPPILSLSRRNQRLPVMLGNMLHATGHMYKEQVWLDPAAKMHLARDFEKKVPEDWMEYETKFCALCRNYCEAHFAASNRTLVDHLGDRFFSFLYESKVASADECLEKLEVMYTQSANSKGLAMVKDLVGALHRCR